MGADVADGAAGAGTCRVGAPCGLLLAGLLDRLGQPVLRVFGLHQADVAELTPLATISRAWRIIG